MKTTTLKKDFRLIFIAGLLLVAASVYAAIGPLPWGPDEKRENGFLVMANTSKDINVWSECWKVTATTKNVYVPTKTQNEWNRFKSGAGNVGASVVPCVTAAVCGNGIVEVGESCDDGGANNNSTPGACYTDCSGRVVGSLSCPSGYNDISVGIYSGNCSSECTNGNIRIISKAGIFVANESCASACTPDAHCVNYVKCVYQTCNGTSPVYNEGQCSIGGSISLGCGASVSAAYCPPDTPTSQCRFMSVDSTDPIPSAFTTTLNCGPGSQTCWDGSVIPSTSSCPHQYTGMWSTGSCSASCGVGTINAPSCSNSDCDPNSKPLSGQSCDTGIACSTPPNHSDTPSCLPCGADIAYIRDDYRHISCGQSGEPVVDIVNYDQQWNGTSWTLVSGTYSSIRNRNIGAACTVGGDLDLGENQFNN